MVVLVSLLFTKIKNDKWKRLLNKIEAAIDNCESLMIKNEILEEISLDSRTQH